MARARAGIMQPYFFPHLGYFSLIARCELWVVFDLTQYTPKTWINRNRVLHPRSGWNWVSVPLAGASQSIAIHQATIADPTAAHRSVLGKLSHYRNRAPHWRRVERLVDAAFAEEADTSLVGLNLRAMAAVCEHLDVDFAPQVASGMDLDLAGVTHAGTWAPVIAAQLGADAYLNPIGGRHLFDPQDFDERGVELCFLDQPTFTYATGPYAFEPQLSILDVLMWNDVAEVRAAIASAEIVHAAGALTR